MDHFLLLYHQPVIGITPRVGVFFNLAFCHLHLHLNLRFGYWRWLSNSRSNNECLVFADLGRDPAIKRNGLSCRPPGLERPINFSPTTNSHTYTHRRTYDVGSLFVLRRINDYVAAGASPRNYLHFSPTEIYRPGPRTYAMIDDLVR
jgi:hypothetical protein